MGRQRFILRGGNGPEEVTVEPGSAAYSVGRGGRVETIEVRKLADRRVSLLFDDGRQLSGRGVRRRDGVEVVTTRGSSRVALADPLSDRIAHVVEEAGGEEKEEEVRALMPGRVLEVCVNPGDSVEMGGLLLVIEAMKMQNEIRARARGAVVRVDVSPGEAVEAGAPLLTIRN